MNVSSIFMDSSAWIHYFYGSDTYVERLLQEAHYVYSSPLSLFEIKRKLLQRKISATIIQSIMTYIKEKSIFVELKLSLMEDAATVSHQQALSAIDAIMYASAISKKALLITSDTDFSGCEHVHMLKKKS